VIELVNCQLRFATIKLVGDMLRDSSVETLDLSSNGITHDGFKYIVEAIKEKHTLKSLKMDNNQLKNEGMTILGGVLQDNPQLTTISVAQNAIGDLGLVEFLQAMSENDKKQGVPHAFPTFNLATNLIGDEGCKALADYVATNPNVREINLHSNLISDLGLAAFAKVMTSANFKVRTLILSHNQLTSKFAGPLTEAFVGVKQSFALDVSENLLIGRKAVAALLQTEAPIIVSQLKLERRLDDGAPKRTESKISKD